MDLANLAKKVHPRARITWTPWDDDESPPRDYEVAARVGKRVLAGEFALFSERHTANERLAAALRKMVPTPQPPRHRDDPLPLP